MAAAPPAARTSAVTVIAMLAAGACGASTVYFALDARAAHRAAEAAKKQAADEGAVVPVAAGDRGAGDEVRRLRAEKLDLLRRLMERETGGAPGRPAPDGGAMKGWTDRLEEMKKNDPERYKRLMERREQRRADMESSREEQLSRIDQRLETLGMADTPQAKKESELLNKIAAVTTELGQIGDKMAALGNLPEAERQAQGQALGQQARELYNQLAGLRAEDRRNQLGQLGASLGLNEDQSAMMSSSVDRIVKETDPRGMRPGRGPGGGGGGGGTRRPP